MNGWLIYDSAGARRNQWFITRLQTLARAQGIRLELKTEMEAGIPDLAIVRTINPSYNAELEARGVRVFNNAATARVACDKWQTYVKCKEWGLPVLPTAQEWTGEIGFPCIVKTVDGHGGAEVFRATNQAEYKRIKNSLNGRRVVVQKQNAVVGADMRVYAIGGELVAGVMRRSATDFRSNFSLGGRVELREADEAQKKIVKQLHDKLGFDFVGIDFFPDGNGGWILNEIEDSAGARMLYSLTDIDIAERFTQYVVDRLNRN